MDLEKGPFKQLHGVWTFKALGDKACKISLDLSFEYDSAIVRATWARCSIRQPIPWWMPSASVLEPSMAKCLAIEVALALPERQWLLNLQLEEGATVEQAVRASGLLEQLHRTARSLPGRHLWQAGSQAERAQADGG